MKIDVLLLLLFFFMSDANGNVFSFAVINQRIENVENQSDIMPNCVIEPPVHWVIAT